MSRVNRSLPPRDLGACIGAHMHVFHDYLPTTRLYLACVDSGHKSVAEAVATSLTRLMMAVSKSSVRQVARHAVPLAAHTSALLDADIDVGTAECCC